MSTHKTYPVALVALQGVLGLVALGLWSIEAAWVPIVAQTVIFMTGPMLVRIDMKTPAPRTWRMQALETAARFAIIASLLPLGQSGATAIVGYLFNFSLMYATTMLSLNQFVVRPYHWLRYDNRLHTGFLAVMVSAIILELGLAAHLKGVGLWLLSAAMLALLVAWRHALWCNASKEIGPEQHAYVWPALAKRSSSKFFWHTLYLYSLQYPATLAPALAAMELPVLLSFFELDMEATLFEGNVLHDFSENVKAAINEKEPRATFIWQLYPPADAAGYIGRIEEFVANAQTESVELPAL